MADYIDRGALAEQLRTIMERYFAQGRVEVAKDYNWAITVLDSAPAADVAPVRHGHWIGEGDGYADGALVYDVWHCSECDYCIDDGTDAPELLPKFCPSCGAKMDGGADHA